MFGFVATMIFVSAILVIGSTIFMMFGTHGLFRSVVDRAERMHREQREHELRLAELSAERESPWRCSHCNSRNLAAEPDCNGCGAPREDHP
jgi:rubrerythrin